MALSTQVRRVWAVLDKSEQVVVLLQGADAAAVAEEWAADGYRVEELPQADFADVA